jgi:PKD repeat protein
LRVIRLLAGGCTAALALFFATASPASATYAYSELTRFGGFDASAYNDAHYGGALTPGDFMDPVGFAVDTEDNTAPNETALYVADRTSGANGTTTTSWRLQKLSDTGAVLGSTTFTLPNEPLTSRSGIVGLAVDDSVGRVYALVVGNAEDGESELPFAKELIAWSTHPEGGKLVAAKEGGSALAADPLGSTGGVIATESQLTKDGVLFVPQGIALDVNGAAHDIAIEASDGTTSSGTSGVSDVPGVAIVQQVATEGVKRGEPLVRWSAASLAKPISERKAAPRGISTDPDGTLTALLGAVEGGVSNTDVVKLSADLSSATVLLGYENTPTDLDLSPAYLAPAPGAFSGLYAAQPVGAGPGLVQLSDPEGLYASTYERDAVSDPESPEGTSYFWHDGVPVLGGKANVGIRLLLPNKTGEISEPKGGTIVNTLGNEAGACSFQGEEEALAAGKNGTLWLLGRGFDTVSDASNEDMGATVGREIVELGPGVVGEDPCPQPSGGFSISKSEVGVGTTVDFSAVAVDLQHGVPFAYEWAPTGEKFTIVNEIGLWPRELDGSLVEELGWPPSTTSYKYTHEGEYEVKLRIRSDYGTYEPPAKKIKVAAPTPPTAKFKVSTSEPIAGQPVTFDVSESSAPFGDPITDYRWEWGDGSKPEEDQTPGPTFQHTFAAAGTYTVKLVITDSEELQSVAFPVSVTVVKEAAKRAVKPIEEIKAEPTSTTSTTTTTTTTTKETPKPTETGSKSLTSAQKLAKALKACKKGPKKRRGSCEKQAKKRYAPKKKSKKKK